MTIEDSVITVTATANVPPQGKQLPGQP